MQTLKRGIIVQITLFTIFFLLGIIYVLHETVFTVEWWIRMPALGLAILGGVIWGLLTNKEAFVIVDRKQVKCIYGAIVSIFVALLLTIVSTYFGSFATYLNIIGGSAMILASVFGGFISFKIFFSDNAGNE